MSIRPIDYTTMVSKIQDLSKVKQEENNRLKNQMDINIVQQQKQIDKNLGAVGNINETENLAIDVNKEREKNRQNKKRKKTKHRKKNESRQSVGVNIDIRI